MILEQTDMACKYCGCTQDRACPGGCYWIHENVCSKCEDKFIINNNQNQSNMSDTETEVTEEAKAPSVKSQQQRRHYVTYKLNQDKILVDAEAKTISLSDEQQAALTVKQQEYIDELKEMGFKLQLQLPPEEKDKGEEPSPAASPEPSNSEPSTQNTPMEYNKPTNFFTEILPHLEHCDIRLIIAKNGDKLSVSMLPQTQKDNQPFRISPLEFRGTDDELNEGFFCEIGKAFNAMNEAGLKTNTQDFLENIASVKKKGKDDDDEEDDDEGQSAAKKKSSSKPKAKSPDEKREAKAKPSKTIKQQVEEALSKDLIDKAQAMVTRANNAGGMPKDKVKELQALVDKAKDAKYYTPEDQKQIQTRIDSLKEDFEKEEKGILNLLEMQPTNKTYATMLKVPQEKIKKLNKLIGEFQDKKLGVKGKTLIPVATLVKNILK